jgi:hypothetical protein
MYVGNARRPNTLVWTMTSNRATLSRDLAQRCVIIRLKRADPDPTWEGQTFDYIETHRWEIIADLLAELRRPVAALGRFSRWAAWEQQVLAHVSDPAQCQQVIAERQQAIDADQEEAELVREQFVKQLQRNQHNPDTCVVWFATGQVASIVHAATGQAIATNKVTPFVAGLGIAELKKSDKSQGKGWMWRGRSAPANATWVPLRPPTTTQQPTSSGSNCP